MAKLALGILIIVGTIFANFPALDDLWRSVFGIDGFKDLFSFTG